MIKNLPRYLLVLDFEANCDNPVDPYPQEITEFPIICYDTVTGLTNTFHKYCKTTIPLTDFSIELTGITQDMVDNGTDFLQVLYDVDVWMNKNGYVDDSTFITYGKWDLKKALPTYCEYLRVRPAEYFKQWINIKDLFTERFETRPKGMGDALNKLGIRHTGRLHSGIDDCRNILEILKRIIN